MSDDPTEQEDRQPLRTCDVCKPDGMLYNSDGAAWPCPHSGMTLPDLSDMFSVGSMIG